MIAEPAEIGCPRALRVLFADLREALVRLRRARLLYAAGATIVAAASGATVMAMLTEAHPNPASDGCARQATTAPTSESRCRSRIPPRTIIQSGRR